MIKSKSKIIIFFLVLLIFFSGIWVERFGVDNKILSIIKNSSDTIYRIIYSFKSNEKISITFKEEDYKKILDVREKSLRQNILTKDLEIWTSAKLNTKNSLHNIRIRLKGIFPDHWSDSTQWSFKIKVNNDSIPIKELRRFALQPPKTTSYIYEWLFMKALEKEELISLGVEFLDLEINNNSRGLYALIGQVSEEILQKNNRTLGPIIGFDSDLWIKEQINSKKLHSKKVIRSLNSNEDSFWRAKIKPVQFEDMINDNDKKNLNKAIYLLESFRQGSLNTSQVFDTDQLAKVMALRAILGSSEFDWLDVKFYYNSETNLLEPISKEIHVDLSQNYKEYFSTWWVDSLKVRPHYFKNTDFFLDTIYKDKKFYEKYLIQLNRLSKIRYYEDLIKINQQEFNQINSKLKFNYPTKKIFSKEHLEITRSRIQDFLNPIQNLTSNFDSYKNGILSLKISNLQRLPIKIIGINIDNGATYYLEDDILIKGKKPFVPLENEEIKFNCKFSEKCKQENIENHKLIFQILGQEKEKKVEINKIILPIN